MNKILNIFATSLLSVTITMSATANAAPSYGGVKWDNYEKGVFDKAQKSLTPILLFVTAEWCQYCKEMNEKTFNDPAIAKYVKNNFLSVSASADDINLVKRYNITALPAIIILDGKGDVLDEFSGYRDSRYTMKVLSHAYRQFQVS